MAASIYSPKVSFHIAPIVDRMAAVLKRSGKLFADETTMPVLAPSTGKTKKGFIWAMLRDDRPWGGADPPGVVFTYAPGRAGIHAETMLKGFEGVLQVDGYTGYNRLADGRRAEGGRVQLAFCWAHARRKLIDARPAAGSSFVDEALNRIAELYVIEKEVRGQSPEIRLAARQERSVPLLTARRISLPQGAWRKAKRRSRRTTEVSPHPPCARESRRSRHCADPGRDPAGSSARGCSCRTAYR